MYNLTLCKSGLGYFTIKFGFRISSFLLWSFNFKLYISSFPKQLLNFDFWVSNFGFELRLLSFAFWVSSFRFRVSRFESSLFTLFFWVLISDVWGKHLKFQIWIFKIWVPNFWFCIPEFVNLTFQCSFWIMEPGFLILGPQCWHPDSSFKSILFGYKVWVLYLKISIGWQSWVYSSCFWGNGFSETFLHLSETWQCSLSNPCP